MTFTSTLTTRIGNYSRARVKPGHLNGKTSRPAPQVIYTTAWQRYVDRIRRMVRAG